MKVSGLFSEYMPPEGSSLRLAAKTTIRISPSHQWGTALLQTAFDVQMSAQVHSRPMRDHVADFLPELPARVNEHAEIAHDR